jgi:hypothetical protein
MPTFVCPQCGDPFTGSAIAEGRCSSCGAPLPTGRTPPSGDPREAPAEMTPRHSFPDEEPEIGTGRSLEPSENIKEFDLSSRDRGAPLETEPAWPDVRIKRGGGGETLAVAALLLPLLVLSLLLVRPLDSPPVGLVLGWSTALLTAVLLAIDAAWLGTVDLEGTQRRGAVAIFLGVVLLWIVCYPLAFFRRRHFGRPNLGPLALLVGGFFIAVPVVQEVWHTGLRPGDAPPTCTSPEVVLLLDNLIRTSPLGPKVQSVGGHREIHYDAATKARKGQCLVKTDADEITVTYTVKWLDHNHQSFQVEVQPGWDLPCCTSPQVMALVERLVKDGPQGPEIKTVHSHVEIRYDRQAKTRFGQCKVTTRMQTITVNYKVSWLDQQAGQFQVEITE